MNPPVVCVRRSLVAMYEANQLILSARRRPEFKFIDFAGDYMIRVVIVDDHAIVRSGLRQFLSDHVDLRVTGEAADGREALELVRGGDLDVLLMDLSMPDQSGVDALAAIKARRPDLPVLILSGFPETHYATTLLRQGASGYLNKGCDPDEIVKAIRTVSMGRRYITAQVAEMLADGAY